MAKRGPKPKVTDEIKKEVYAMLKVGASLQDAAGCLEIDHKTLRRAARNDPKFGRGVIKAIKDGKLLLIRKVGKAKPWQAAAWMLERKFGEEFGRREKHEISGQLKTGPSNEVIRQILADPESIRLANALARRMAGNPVSNGESSN